MKHAIVLDAWETNEWFRSRDTINEKVIAAATKISRECNVEVSIVDEAGVVLQVVKC